MKVKNERQPWFAWRRQMAKMMLGILQAEGPMTATSMGKQTGYVHSTCGRHLARMEIEGLVSQKTLWRKRLFTITEAGTQYIRKEVVKNE